MIPNNKFTDYSNPKLTKMFEQAADFFKVFEECGAKIDAVKSKKLKVVKDTTLPNDIHVNPKIKVDFIKLKDEKLDLDVIFEKYDEWFDELYKLTVVNEPWLAHKAVFQHVGEILAICYTFQEYMTLAKEQLKDQQ